MKGIRRTTVNLTEATDRQVKELSKAGFGSFTDIVRIAIDRMYQQYRREKAMYKVYTADEVLEVATLGDAKQAVATEWNPSGEADKSGFINPWIEDQDGNQIPYTPTQDEMDTWK